MIDPNDMTIRIACPLCGETHFGNADEIVEWRTEHKCRRPDGKVRIMRVENRRAG
jgi:hypothetical protein